MAARGANAKVVIENKLREVFGADFIGVQDRKLYIAADDGNGEKVQICLALSCPKVPLGTVEGGIDFDNMPAAATSGTNFQPAQITSEETENVRKLLEKLGL